MFFFKYVMGVKILKYLKCSLCCIFKMGILCTLYMVWSVGRHNNNGWSGSQGGEDHTHLKEQQFIATPFAIAILYTATFLFTDSRRSILQFE